MSINDRIARQSSHTPLIILAETIRDSQIDSEGHIEAEYIGLELLRQSLAPSTFFIQFGRVDGYDGINTTYTQTHNDASKEHHRHRPILVAQARDEHEQISQRSKGKTGEYPRFPPYLVCHQAGKYRSDGTSKIVYRNYDADQRILLFYAHCSEIVVVGVDEGHHSLVVAIEGNGCGREDDHLRLLVHECLCED